MTAAFDVLTIGNAIVDVLSSTEDGFLQGNGLIKGSMRLIDDVEAHRLYDIIGPAIVVSGGSAANTAAGIASLGGKAAFIGKVRNDELGTFFTHDIRAAGVTFDVAPSTDGPATARSFILVTPDGERTMNTYLGACVTLSPSDIDEKVVAAAEITYLEGYLWDPPEAKDAFVKAARAARGAGRKVALTLSDSFCVDRHRDSFRDLISRDVDILFANEREIISLYETTSFDDALQRARAAAELVVLTRSGAGSVIVRGDEFHVVEARKVERVVDATGAGDLYAAGFLYGLTHGKPLVEAARLGSLAAAEIISHIGARPQTSLGEEAEAAGLL
ncbi:MAG TPA: adenosine kinase [Aestuariivirgaceae bacterium]|nr:adenosine kinase [Aestuariivirgaceae bacterium]